MIRKRASVLYARGFNCEEETMEIIRRAGGIPRLVFLDDILKGREKITDCDIFCIPGGFSYGDHIDAGAVVALLMKEEFPKLVDAGIPVNGNCNGNQILVRFGAFGDKITMVENDSGRFCSHPFVRHHVFSSNCVWTEGLERKIITFPAAHRFGKYDGDLNSAQIVLMFNGFSPNGGLVAGICSDNGRIFATMNHPERALDNDDCIQIYRNGLKAA
ncbi:MAG: phosphoribosylformylglycinamidine synthase subunit PurQ [Candidatus Moraniibacteriota bacterium]